jgi:hypothetical protein
MLDRLPKDEAGQVKAESVLRALGVADGTSFEALMVSWERLEQLICTVVTRFPPTWHICSIACLVSCIYRVSRELTMNSMWNSTCVSMWNSYTGCPIC